MAENGKWPKFKAGEKARGYSWTGGKNEMNTAAKEVKIPELATAVIGNMA